MKIVDIKILPNRKIVIDGEDFEEKKIHSFTMAQTKALISLRDKMESFPGLYKDNMNKKNFR